MDGKVCVEEAERLGHDGLLHGAQREVLLRYLDEEVEAERLHGRVRALLHLRRRQHLKYFERNI